MELFICDLCICLVTLTGGLYEGDYVWALFEWPQYLIYAQALNSRAIIWCKSTVLKSDWTPEKNKNEHIKTNRFRHDTNQQEVRPIGGFFAPRPQKAEKYLLCPKHKGHRTQLEPMGHSFVSAGLFSVATIQKSQAMHTSFWASYEAEDTKIAGMQATARFMVVRSKQ